MQVVSKDSAAHYTWGGQCDCWFLLKDSGIHVIQENMPAGSSEVMHYHHKSKQLFYVLRGELTMRSESSSVKVPTGHAVVIEPGIAHQARNESDETLDLLVISCPPSHGDRTDCK